MQCILGIFLTLIIFVSTAHAAADVRVFKLFQARQWKEAVLVAQAYALANPKDAQAQFVHSVALMYNSELSKAHSVLNSLIEKYPNVSSPYNNLGVIYLAEGKLKDAKKAFQTTLALDARHTNAQRNLALLQETATAVAVEKAHIDKRGMEFLGLPNTPAIPASVPPYSAASTIHVLAVTVATPHRAASGAAMEKIVAPATPSSIVDFGLKSKSIDVQGKSNSSDEEIKRQVLEAITSWAKAWAKKDADSYLYMYSPDFLSGNKKSRAAWEQQRRQRIGDRGQIRINAVDVVIEVGSSTAAVATFQQNYRADGLNEISNKMLVFIRESEQSRQWRIVDERTSY